MCEKRAFKIKSNIIYHKITYSQNLRENYIEKPNIKVDTWENIYLNLQLSGYVLSFWVSISKNVNPK